MSKSCGNRNEKVEHRVQWIEMYPSMLKSGLGCTEDEMRRLSTQPTSSAQAELPDGAVLGVAANAPWFVSNLSNNNNECGAEALLCKPGNQQTEAVVRAGKTWSFDQGVEVAEEQAVGDSIQYVDVELDGVNKVNAGRKGESATLKEENGIGDGGSANTPHMFATQSQLSPESTAACSNVASHYAMVGAGACLTPPANSSSNRTSVNNSTDNLSYSSDNCYPDELFVLQGAPSADNVENDEDAERISVYSDDCVYAYRGDGADYELSMAAINNRSRFVDDETDFLEMDFEPDPLSEMECSGGVSAMDTMCSFRVPQDACILSSTDSHEQRHLYSSPADNMMSSPLQKNGGLQSQSSLLSRNFARVALNLDQIKSDETPTPAGGIRRESACFATEGKSIAEVTEPLAHSLPNSLLATFGRDTLEKQEVPTTSPSKVTGAKPKRLNTFSTSSSTSSKNSLKSRTSVRSVVIPAAAICSSNNGFNERRASCTDFRCSPSDDLTTNVAGCSEAATGTLNDETCLDCLEKEFLANTIGKEVDLNACQKCRRVPRAHDLMYGGEMARGRNMTPHHMKSNSINYEFTDLASDALYQVELSTSTEFMPRRRRNEERDRSFPGELSKRGDDLLTENILLDSGSSRSTIGNKLLKCKKHLLRNIWSEKVVSTVSTNNLDEETLVHALEKLHVTYNADLIKLHFKPDTRCAAAQDSIKEFKSLKHFILHASKQNSNHFRLQRLIEKATYGQVEVVYRKDPLVKKTEILPLKVADVLHQWKHCDDLQALKELDKRFQESNVLGKIANIIRQAQQRGSPRRSLPEFIMIPQFYASGYLTLTKK